MINLLSVAVCSVETLMRLKGQKKNKYLQDFHEHQGHR